MSTETLLLWPWRPESVLALSIHTRHTYTHLSLLPQLVLKASINLEVLVILYETFLAAYYHPSPESTHRHICNLYFESISRFKLHLNLLRILSSLISCGVADHIPCALCIKEIVATILRLAWTCGSCHCLVYGYEQWNIFKVKLIEEVKCVLRGN